MKAYLFVLTLKQQTEEELNEIIQPFIGKQIDTDYVLADWFCRINNMCGKVKEVLTRLDLSGCEWLIDVDKSIKCKYQNPNEENEDFEKTVKEILIASTDCWITVLVVHY